MTEVNRCAECGSELAADSPQGLCPGCLLKRGLETNTFATGGGASSSADFVPPTPAELSPAISPIWRVSSFSAAGHRRGL